MKGTALSSSSRQDVEFTLWMMKKSEAADEDSDEDEDEDEGEFEADGDKKGEDKDEDPHLPEQTNGDSETC